MRNSILALCTGLSLLYASECTYVVTGKPELQWEAYKTPLKIGVKGGFKEIDLAHTQGKSIETLLTGLQAHIRTVSVNSGNEGRDRKIAVAFFGKMRDTDMIEAVVKTVRPSSEKSGVMDVEITMNAHTKIVPMRYKIDGDEIEAEGVLDILDFGANEALASLNKACYDKHAGKTWSDVAISLELHYEKRCK